MICTICTQSMGADQVEEADGVREEAQSGAHLHQHAPQHGEAATSVECHAPGPWRLVRALQGAHCSHPEHHCLPAGQANRPCRIPEVSLGMHLFNSHPYLPEFPEVHLHISMMDQITDRCVRSSIISRGLLWTLDCATACGSSGRCYRCCVIQSIPEDQFCRRAQ